jgi:hypothetical protein
MKTNTERIVRLAGNAAAAADSWADLSNALFDPEHGLVARAYPTRRERERFLKSSEYRAIRQMIDAARERYGLVAGATPTKSGKFVVRLPRSLHAALEAEASAEGVSLNQLVVAKLAMQLSHLVQSDVREDAHCTGTR